MNTHIPIPDIPDDKVQPKRPDISWLTTTFIIGIGLIVGTYIFFWGFSTLIIQNFTPDQEVKYFGENDIPNTKLFDIQSITPNIQLPEYVRIWIWDNDEINAYSALGGNIYFTTGFLDSITYQDEFIFVLGHEIGHFEHRHMLKRITKHLPFSMTLAFLGNYLDIGFTTSFNVGSNYFSKKDELQADQVGIKYVQLYGDDPYCATYFFINQDNPLSPYMQIYSTHPTDINRINSIESHAEYTDFSQCATFQYQNLPQ